MRLRIDDVIQYRSDRLFHGAVNLDWFLSDPAKRSAAATGFVFHGPTYHGVVQGDVGVEHGHALLDTATFTRDVVRRCCGQDDEPFSLAIAGYGTGKSHLALTLASLLSNPGHPVSQEVLRNLQAVDQDLGGEVKALLHEQSKPCLLIALNGMGNFDLTSEITRLISLQVRTHPDGLDVSPLERLRPRFSHATSLVRMASEAVLGELTEACSIANAQGVLDRLEQQDESMFCIVQEFFSSRGMPIRALGGESVKDLIDVTCKNYCGINLPFSHLLVLFDEFGRYTEFATTKRQIAGSGVLQDLFEAIQANAAHTTFVGFIQFELNAYVQRVNPEYRNDILRYVTRYQSARKTYLSTNLETLIANLLEKKDIGVLSTWFGHDLALQESQSIRNDINSWFPQSRNHRLWIDPKLFHRVVRTGCWPLSPHATWFFYYLAAAGKHLQERSALTLLGDAIARVKEKELKGGACWTLSLADLWSSDLCQELLSSEETGQQGSVAHAYTSVESRYKAKLSDTLLRLLRTIVLTSKLGMDVDSEDEAIRALAVLSGLDGEIAAQGLEELAAEFNVIEWDPTFKQFLILGDAASRSQFFAFLQKRVAVRFDHQRKAELFASRVTDWCDCLGEVSTGATVSGRRFQES